MYRENISILVADEIAYFRDGLIAALESESRYKVVGEAKNGEELIEKTSRLNPDIALIDISLPIINGIEATKAIKSLGKPTEVIALSMHVEEFIVLKMLQAGAMGYVEKNISIHEMHKAINSVVLDRRMYFPESTSRRMFQLLQKTSLNPFHNPELIFSETEREIIQLVCEDFTNRQIGEQLEISKRTIEGHRERIMKKMNVKSVAGLVAYAYTNHLLKHEYNATSKGGGGNMNKKSRK